MSGFQIRFDGPPGPVAGRFIEVEDLEGRGLGVGRWEEQADGTWLLIVEDPSCELLEAARDAADELRRGLDDYATVAAGVHEALVRSCPVTTEPGRPGPFKPLGRTGIVLGEPIKKKEDPR